MILQKSIWFIFYVQQIPTRKVPTKAWEVLRPKGTYLSGERPVLENVLLHTTFTPKGPSTQESTASSHSFPSAASCSLLHMLNPKQQALWRLRTDTLVWCFAESQYRKKYQIQLVAASAAGMTHNKTLNQLALQRNCRLCAQEYHITIVRRKVMNR